MPVCQWAGLRVRQFASWPVRRSAGRWGVVAFFLAALAIVFIAMSRTVLLMIFDAPDEDVRTADAPRRGRFLEILAPLLLLLLALAAGTALPQGIESLIQAAAREVGL